MDIYADKSLNQVAAQISGQYYCGLIVYKLVVRSNYAKRGTATGLEVLNMPARRLHCD